MIREAKEEAGIIIKKENLKIVQVMNRKSDTEERIYYFFIVKKYDGEITNMQPNKCDDLKWFDIDNLPDNMVSYIDYAITMYLRNNNFTIFGWE